MTDEIRVPDMTNRDDVARWLREVARSAGPREGAHSGYAVHTSAFHVQADAVIAATARLRDALVGEEVFVVHHEGCGDEPGPAPVPLEAEALGDEISAVAFTTREDAERAMASAWPDGVIETYLLVRADKARAALDGKAGG